VCNTSSEHLLQHCPLQNTPRKAAWTEDLLLMEKLHEDPEVLRRTAV